MNKQTDQKNGDELTHLTDLPDLTDLTVHKSEEEENTRANLTSILFEKYAFLAILVVLIIALWFRIVPLIAITTLLLVLTLLVITWKRMSLTSVTPKVSLPRSRVFAGDSFTIDAKLANKKWLPLVWIEWEYPHQPGIAWGDAENGYTAGERYTIRFLWLLWLQQIEWSITGKALRRGIYPFGHILLRSGDGFRFAEDERMHCLKALLYVYPRILSVHVPALPFSLRWDLKGKKGGLLEDPLLISGIREYESGDEWKRINWLASARTGSLQTNVYQPVLPRDLFVYIDVRGFRTYDENDTLMERTKDFERFLSLVASVSSAYHHRGLSIGYGGNALTHHGKPLPIAEPSSTLVPFLDQLAGLRSSTGKMNLDTLSARLTEKRLSPPLIIFCDRLSKQHERWYERNKERYPYVRFYYYEDKDDDQQSSETVGHKMSSFMEHLLHVSSPLSSLVKADHRPEEQEERTVGQQN